MSGLLDLSGQSADFGEGCGVRLLVEHRIQHAAVRLAQGVGVGGHGDDRPLQQFSADVAYAAAMRGPGFKRQPAYGRGLQEALVPGVADALREGVVFEELELGDDSAVLACG